MPYYVYVIELEKTVAEIQKFRGENPDYLSGKACFYVGQSACLPAVRFAQHKDGYKHNRYAKKYGLWLRPRLYERYNPINTRAESEAQEKSLALKLRSKGYGVWYG